ncbi:MAG TPA: hypothetical protein PLS90_01665 [Candidatus Sumerlaeota bacterium]|nr:MAG: hypothetical protein BWZ08_00317 [candidate division BRC1 bacterium ADurb.BinA292]HOE96380.1 hypothetical protein [Candidatus Sumerlaeota bacterium]HOR27274.1 hypothetical protein [Candidatus Sumerlaeota bacterium]HPK01141.1 hypothetical protein [Candidatus Sumerlaeota bacterium]
MSLKVELTVEKTDLAFDENTRFEVTITNVGRESVMTMNPADCWTLPALRVVSIEQGLDRIYRRDPNLFIEEVPSPLLPGQSLSGTHRLLTFVKFQEPGEYEISALWEWNGKVGRAFSEPVHVTIRAMRPRHPHTVSMSGGPAAIFNSVWVNVATPPGSLTRSRYDLINKPKTVHLQSLGQIGPSAEPVLSVPINGGASDRQWIAWFEGDELRFGRVDDLTEQLDIKTLPLSPVPKQIVPPLNHQPGVAGLEGRFFLWQGNVEGDISRFQAVHLTTRGDAEPGANVMLGRLRPRWMEAAFPSNGSAQIYFVLPTQGENFLLQAVDWSADGEPSEVKKLAQFDGEFHGGATALAADDTLHGTLLVLEPGPEAARELGLYCWKRSAAGQFEASDILLVPREPMQKVDRAVVGVSSKGDPALLIRFQGSDWQFYDEQHGLVPLPAEIAQNDLPLELLFLISGTPVIKYAVENKGFYYLSAAGIPVETPAHG